MNIVELKHKRRSFGKPVENGPVSRILSTFIGQCRRDCRFENCADLETFPKKTGGRNEAGNGHPPLAACRQVADGDDQRAYVASVIDSKEK